MIAGCTDNVGVVFELAVATRRETVLTRSRKIS